MKDYYVVTVTHYDYQNGSRCSIQGVYDDCDRALQAKRLLNESFEPTFITRSIEVSITKTVLNQLIA